MAEITFLAPGSCQLEVTAQGNVGTDTGVDLTSVSWTIEQALIAGCRFSPSAGDVHIDRNGVLTIGRSLFDRINQANGDDAIPGQCTLIIRADSTITDNVLDRFKVLVGYPGEGGGSGGGGGVGVHVGFLSGPTVDDADDVSAQVPFGNATGNLYINALPGNIIRVPSGDTYWFTTGSVTPSPHTPKECKAFYSLNGDSGPIGENVELPVIENGVNSYRCAVPKLDEVTGAEYRLFFVILTDK